MKTSNELDACLAMVRQDARRMKGTVQRLLSLFPNNPELLGIKHQLTSITKSLNVALEGPRKTGDTPED